MSEKTFRVAAVAVAAVAASAASAGTITLEDGMSSAVFDLESSAGMSDWVVDGVDHLAQQWFWFRTGSMTAEASLDTLPLLGSAAVDTNPFKDTRPDRLSALYGSQDGLQIEVTWSLRGGLPGSNTADIAELIELNNGGDEPLTVSFFQYNDLDIGGTSGGDIAQIAAGGQIANQFDIDGFTVQETVLTPMPEGWEVATYPVIRDSLEDDSVTTLGIDGGPVGPDDVTYAFEWRFTLQPGESFLISKNKQIVPTPGAAALLGIAGLAAVRRRRG